MFEWETQVTSNRIKVCSAFFWTLRLGCVRRQGAIRSLKPTAKPEKVFQEGCTETLMDVNKATIRWIRGPCYVSSTDQRRDSKAELGG